MFCTREAFRATGGFNERLYCGEENWFALALKREGRFAGLWQPALTSGRRLRKTSGLQVVATFSRLIFFPGKMKQRSSVEKVWYDSNRKDDDVMPKSWAARISNGITLLIVAVALTNPIWGHLPWSWTPLSTPLGIMRLFTGVFLCHVAMLVFWPVALALLINFLRQKRFTGVIQSALLIVFFGSNAWDATSVVVRTWTHIYHWLA
jgi:hypothetical protein